MVQSPVFEKNRRKKTALHQDLKSFALGNDEVVVESRTTEQQYYVLRLGGKGDTIRQEPVVFGSQAGSVSLHLNDISHRICMFFL